MQATWKGQIPSVFAAGGAMAKATDTMRGLQGKRERNPAWQVLTGLLIFGLGLSACATSRVTAFRDPAYATAHFSKLLVFATGMAFESEVQVENDICKKLAPTPCLTGMSVLPPTRAYSGEEVRERINDSGADAVLITGLLTDQANSRYLGTYTRSSANYSSASSGTANLYGNYANWSGLSSGSASSSTVSTPVYGYTRVAHGLLSLYDSKTGNVVWRGEITTSGNGMLSVTDKEFIRSATSKIASELRSAGLVQ
jgi:hypothetical protein